MGNIWDSTTGAFKIEKWLIQDLNQNSIAFSFILLYVAQGKKGRPDSDSIALMNYF